MTEAIQNSSNNTIIPFFQTKAGTFAKVAIVALVIIAAIAILALCGVLLPHASIGAFILHFATPIGAKAISGSFFAGSFGLALSIVIAYFKHRKAAKSEVPPLEIISASHGNSQVSSQNSKNDEGISFSNATNKIGKANLLSLKEALRDKKTKDQPFQFKVQQVAYNAWFSDEAIFIQNQKSKAISKISLSPKGEIVGLDIQSNKQTLLQERHITLINALINQCMPIKPGKEEQQDPSEINTSKEFFSLFRQSLEAVKFIQIKINDCNYDFIHLQPDTIFVKGDNGYELKIEINVSGEIIKFNENDKGWIHSNALSSQADLIINSAFRIVLQNSSKYEFMRPTDSGTEVINVAVIRKSIKEIPETHLNLLSEIIEREAKNNRLPKLFVSFVIGKIKAKGHDSGGLSRDYLDELFAALINSSMISFEKVDHGGYLPYLKVKNDEKSFLSKEQEKIFYQMGIVLMYCFLSSNTDYHGNNNQYWIGHYFKETLFSAILSLTSQEVDSEFSDLTLETKLKICRQIGSTKFAKDAFKFLDTKNPTIDQLKKAVEDLNSFEETKDLFDLNSLALGQTEKIKHALANIIVSQHELYLQPIHAMAKGMKFLGSNLDENSKSFDKGISWDNFKKIKPEKVAEKIQGKLDRNAIANSFKFHRVNGDDRKIIEVKLKWLQEWIIHEASDQELRNLAKFICGTNSFPNKEILIQAQKELGTFLPFPKAHSCTPALDFSPKKNTKYKLGKETFSDGNKKDFIRGLKICCLADPSAYSDS